MRTLRGEPPAIRSISIKTDLMLGRAKVDFAQDRRNWPASRSVAPGSRERIHTEASAREDEVLPEADSS
jgi:hypothetical protein